MMAKEGWFESVEVQTPPAATPGPERGVGLPKPTIGPDGWEDLLAPLTPEVVAQTGEGWSMREHALRSPKKDALLPLPGNFAGTSYQMRVKLRDEATKESLTLLFPVGDRSVGLSIDGWPHEGFFSGLNKVNGVRPDKLPGSLHGPQVKPGETHELEVTVRPEGPDAKISTTLDARPFYEWTGPIATLSAPWWAWITSPGSPGLGSVTDGWTVSEVKARRLAAPAGGSEAPAAKSPAAATKETPFENSLGMRFVPVPIGGGPTAGQRVLFSIWDTRVQDYAAYAAANPDVNGEWKLQHKDAVPVGREPFDPVVGVSWEEAKRFCEWLTEKEKAAGRLPAGMAYRLPADEEWSWAVGLPAEVGSTPEEKSKNSTALFPWGKDFPPRSVVGNYADETYHAQFPDKKNAKGGTDNQWIKGYTDGYATTSPVGSFPPNAYGLYDMGGNVFQWCDAWPDASGKGQVYVYRGGSWVDCAAGSWLRSGRRGLATSPSNVALHYGFRCVLSAASAP
jgi:hypothetical protein